MVGAGVVSRPGVARDCRYLRKSEIRGRGEDDIEAE